LCTAYAGLVKPNPRRRRLQKSKAAGPPGAVAGRGGRADRRTAACERSQRARDSGPSGPALAFGPAGSSWPPAPPCSRSRWSASLRSILLSPFEFKTLPLSRSVRRCAKHYVVALEEPNVFSNLSPPRWLTPRPARKCASAWGFAPSGSLRFERRSPWPAKCAPLPHRRRPFLSVCARIL